MRPNANSRRSRGRGGRKSGNSRNQTFDSNGPGARVRGNASQIYEKYQQLARDAASSGDRVGAENFFQHAEHYYRLMSANGTRPDQRNGDGRGSDEGSRSGDSSNEDGETAQQAESENRDKRDDAGAAKSESGKGNGTNGRRRRASGGAGSDDGDKAQVEADESADEGETAPA